MPNFQDRGYRSSAQYKDAGKLNARIQLHKRFTIHPCGWSWHILIAEKTGVSIA